MDFSADEVPAPSPPIDEPTTNTPGVSGSYEEDIRRAAENAQRNPHFTVTLATLKDYRIRAWEHKYHPRYVQHLIKLVYGSA